MTPTNATPIVTARRLSGRASPTYPPTTGSGARRRRKPYAVSVTTAFLFAASAMLSASALPPPQQNPVQFEDAQHPLAPVTQDGDSVPLPMETVWIPAGTGSTAAMIAVHLTLPSTILGADGNRSTGDDVRVPVVATMTPYAGSQYSDPTGDGAAFAQAFAARGYAVAVADSPGTGLSTGCLDFMGPNERAAIYALVEWLGTQAWSTGKVGLVGASYPGGAALLGGVVHPPHLTTVVAVNPMSDPYAVLHQGGIRRSEGDPQQRSGITTLNLEFLALSASHVCPGTVEHVQQQRIDTTRDTYWQERDIVPQAGRLSRQGDADSDVTALVITSWRDLVLQPDQATRFYAAIPVDDPTTGADEGVPFKMLVVDKAPHWGFDGPDNSILSLKSRQHQLRLAHAWLDQYLYGYDTNVEDQDPVWTVGNDGYSFKLLATLNREQSWPPEGTTDIRLYLRPDGGFDYKKPTGADATDVGSWFDTAVENKGQMLNEAWLSPVTPGAGAGHGTFLWFQTEPLATDLRLAGEMALSLQIASNRESTNVVVTLFDLGVVDDEYYDRIGTTCTYTIPGPWPQFDPDSPQNESDLGLYPVHKTACTIGWTALDANLAWNPSSPQPLVPGQPFTVRLRAADNDWIVPADHRIGLAVTSSDAWDLESDVTFATNTLLSSHSEPSWVSLPVVGGKEAAKQAFPGGSADIGLQEFLDSLV